MEALLSDPRDPRGGRGTLWLSRQKVQGVQTRGTSRQPRKCKALVPVLALLASLSLLFANWSW